MYLQLLDLLLQCNFIMKCHGSFLLNLTFIFVSQSFLKNDFVLVSGDVVSNMKLEQVLQEHK